MAVFKEGDVRCTPRGWVTFIGGKWVDGIVIPR